MCNIGKIRSYSAFFLLYRRLNAELEAKTASLVQEAEMVMVRKATKIICFVTTAIVLKVNKLSFVI